MDENAMSSQLSLVRRHLRVAFAAQCAERVLPIAVYQLSETSALSRAVDMCWEYATGNAITFPDFDDVYEAIEAGVPDVQLSPNLSASSMVWQSVLAAIDSVTDSTGSSSATSATLAVEAIDLLTDFLEVERIDSEVNWQERAVRLVSGWGDQRIERGMFASMGDEPPGWRGLLIAGS